MTAADSADPPPADGDENSGLVDDGLDELRLFGFRQTWPSGATLLQQGEQPRLLFVIERGEVALWDESGPERRLVQIVHDGASVGDLPVLLDEPCLYTAVARGETITLGFSREQVHDLLALDPQICFLWLRLLSRRLTAGYPRLVSLAGRSAGERVARFLLDELGADEGARIALTQSELASATGISRQRVSHVLRALERLGLVERGRGGIRVLDPGRLRATLPR